MEKSTELKVIWNNSKNVPEQIIDKAEERGSFIIQSELQKQFFSGQITAKEYQKKIETLRIV